MAAATFDLLFSACDRHSSNAFIGAGSRLTLIDHDTLTMNDTWRPCGVSSMFLPSTRKFEELIHGMDFVRGRSSHPLGFLNPLLLLDYRCHARGGAIGKNYPIAFEAVMRKIAAMPTRDVATAYGFLDWNNAASLRARAEAMLAHGFEHTLEHLSGNDEEHRYPWQPSCCDIIAERGWFGGFNMRCAHHWEPIVTARPSAATNPALALNGAP